LFFGKPLALHGLLLLGQTLLRFQTNPGCQVASALAASSKAGQQIRTWKPWERPDIREWIQGATTTSKGYWRDCSNNTGNRTFCASPLNGTHGRAT
jgi:hypothetical protein